MKPIKGTRSTWHDSNTFRIKRIVVVHHSLDRRPPKKNSLWKFSQMFKRTYIHQPIPGLQSVPLHKTQWIVIRTQAQTSSCSPLIPDEKPTNIHMLFTSNGAPDLTPSARCQIVVPSSPREWVRNRIPASKSDEFVSRRITQKHGCCFAAVV